MYICIINVYVRISLKRGKYIAANFKGACTNPAGGWGGGRANHPLK